MEKIIDPIPVELIKAELTPDKKLIDTNKGGNEIYVVNWHNAPNTVREIGRLREIAFRQAGGSSGLSCDLDEFDTMESPYQQMLVWDPDGEAILGGYRYILGPDIKFGPDGQPVLATSHQFKFSREFCEHYLPHMMELGRSFVSPEYQSSKAGAKALFSLDNLWDGIIAVIYPNPNIFYVFGKVTMYPSYDRLSRDLVLRFIAKHFGDKRGLIESNFPVEKAYGDEVLDLILTEDSVKDDYKLLKAAVRRRGTVIPPLVNSYILTSDKTVYYGTSINDLMGDVEESAILMRLEEMNMEKIGRHIETYLEYRAKQIRGRFPLLESDLKPRLKDRVFAIRDRVFRRK